MPPKTVVQPDNASDGAVAMPLRHEFREPHDVRVIEPTKRRLKLATLLTAGPVIRVLSVRDLKAKYKQTLLGPIWLLVQPLGILAAFTVVFDGVAEVDTSGVPYALFGLTGICVWSFFQLSLANGVGAVFVNKVLVRRISAPRVAFPVTGAVIQVPVLIATLMLTIVTVYLVGAGLPTEALLLPVAIVWLLIVTCGTLLLLSALTVRFRDVFAAVPLITQAGIFLTPVGYPLPTDASTLVTVVFAINPLTGLIEFWRMCTLSGFDPNMLAIGLSVPLTVAVAVAGWWVFGRLEVKFADYV